MIFSNFTATIWIGILGFIAIQGLLLFFVFPNYRGGSKTAKWLLAVSSLICSILATIELLAFTIGIEQLPHLIYSQSPFWYLLSSLIFMYIRVYTKNQVLRWTDLLHLLPAIWVTYQMMSFYTLPVESKLDYFRFVDTNGKPATAHNIYLIVFSIQSAFYCFLGFRFLRKSDSTGHRRYQSHWLKFFLGGLALFTLMGALRLTSLNFGLGLEDTKFLFLVWLSLFLLVLFFKSVRSPKDLYHIGSPPMIKVAALSNRASELFEAMKQFMSDKAPYRDPQYDIQMLAKEFGQSKNFISQLIRDKTGLNFRDFINNYRIEDAKEKLNSPMSKQYTIQTIASDSGFKSLATFYRVFKKVEGTTPKSYIRQ